MNCQNTRKKLEESLNEGLLFCDKKNEIITRELFNRKKCYVNRPQKGPCRELRVLSYKEKEGLN